jgi:hypothetical protein
MFTFAEERDMERNDDFTNTGADVGGSTGAGSTGLGAGYGAGGMGGSMGTQDAGSTSGGYGAGSGFAETGTGTAGQSRIQQGKEAVSSTLNKVKEKATNLDIKGKASTLNATLADKLEAGADKLRQRGQSAQLAGSAGTTDFSGTGTGTGTNQQLSQVGDRLATGMQSTADWLRNGDLQGSIENQVRTNPGRTLLVALGLGYVLGKAFRR